MTHKARIEKLEAKVKPKGRLYVILENDSGGITFEGHDMTRAEFDRVYPQTDEDILIRITTRKDSPGHTVSDVSGVSHKDL